MGLTLALAFHCALTRARVLAPQRSAAKPLTTQFVKRQPRLTKPLELKRRPQPTRRRLQREMVSVRAKTPSDRLSGGIVVSSMLGGVARPRVYVGRSASLACEFAEPRAIARAVEQARESRHALQMSLEMLDISALDTGRYQAMVVQDPSDKRNIKGYLHLAAAYPFSMRMREWHKLEDRLMNAIRRLVSRLNEWTRIQASLAKRVTFDSGEFLRSPWVYLWVQFSLEPTRREEERLGEYLLGGGFFFFEGPRLGTSQGERSLEGFVEASLASRGYRKGVEWEYESLPSAHPIFHCYYDFPAGIPIGASLISKNYWDSLGRDDGIVEPRNRAIEIEGRVAAFNTNQGYCSPWSDWGNANAPHAQDAYAGFDPTVQFQFGINTIIFALTQEGGITHRLMDSIQH